jgi:PAS domain S-box-containing protein
MDDATEPYSETEVAAALAGGPFRGAFATGAPLVVVAGAPAKARFATLAALELFETPTLEALNGLLIAAESPGARRLRRLAALGGGRSAPRLEQLRFYGPGAPISLGLFAARIEGQGGEPWLVLAASTKPEPAVAPPSHEEAPALAPEAESPPAEAAFVAPPLDGPVRFLWSLDAEGRFLNADPALTARLGANAPHPDEPLSALIERTALDAGWIEAVNARKTFSGLRLEWPESYSAQARIVKLSGAPHWDRARAYAGFQGFGVFTGEGVERVAEAPPREETPAEASPTVEAVETAQAEPPAIPPQEVQPRAGAEIFVLRPGASANNNVVPIRPVSLNVLTGAADSGVKLDPEDSVELSSHERDAFREIARALGARSREEKDENEGSEYAPQDDAAEPSEPAAPNAELAALIDALPIGALVCRDGAALFANRALLDFVGENSLDAFRASGALAKMFRGRNPETLLAAGEDAPVVAANGELTTVHAQAVEVAWGGEPATLISLRRSRDIEHQQRALALEADAMASARLARDHLTALDAACDGFVRLDASGRILSMSPRAEFLFGYDQKETAGANFLTLLTPQSQAPGLAAFLDAIGSEYGREAPPEIEAQARTSNGRVFNAGMVFGRLLGSDQPEAFFVIHDRDNASATLREVQAARDAAEKSNERKTEFLAVVSHEIRTPLQAILGFAEVMIDERFGPIGNERYKDYMKDIFASGQHVISLANDLIDLAKIESGKMELVFEPVDVNQTIRDCVALMQPQASRERILMRMSLFDRLPYVMADQRSLRQIMLNLMSNAVKFNEPGGQVIVSTALDDAGAVMIRVRDTGVGMSEGELGLALEPFRRAEGGKIVEGTGLGLPLTKALVEANHADFSIKSRKEQGTLVEVAFASVHAAQ